MSTITADDVKSLVDLPRNMAEALERIASQKLESSMADTEVHAMAALYQAAATYRLILALRDLRNEVEERGKELADVLARMG